MNIQTTAIVLQAVWTSITILLFIIKPFRLWFFGHKSRKQCEERMEAAEQESVKCLLRSEIVRIYYANRERQSLHSFEYQNISMLYNSYKEMGGNSFVDNIWEKVQEWAIVP
jgi:glucan phosphorylase